MPSTSLNKGICSIDPARTWRFSSSQRAMSRNCHRASGCVSLGLHRPFNHLLRRFHCKYASRDTKIF